MFNNVNSTLFTVNPVKLNTQVQNKSMPIASRDSMQVRTQTMEMKVSGLGQKQHMIQMSAGIPSQQKRSFNFAPKSFNNSDFGKNNFSRVQNGPSMSAASDLTMKMSAVPSGMSFKASGANVLSSNGMPIKVSRQSARSGAGPYMSMGFDISGAKSSQVIEDFQDVQMGAVKRTKAKAGWGVPPETKSRSRTIMMAVPEGSWGDVKRQPVVGGNWKSNGDRDFAQKFPQDVLNKSKFDSSKMSVCVAPTDIHLTTVAFHANDDINVMAQDVSQYPKGAYTGNVTSDQLKDIGVNWTLTGHSERRTLQAESDADVAKKTKAAIANGVTVMACIGEQLEERESGKTDEVNARQLKAIADELEVAHWGDVVIAYEPVWAIGTGKVATPEQAEETHLHIRKWLAENVSEEVAGATRILYGGSVNAGNCSELITKPNIDGFLVGGASLKEDFKTIIETVNDSI